MTRTSLRKAKRRLAVLWFVASALLIALILIQTITGKYQNLVSQAWSWLLPTVMPTLSLVVAVLVSDQLGRNPHERAADPFLLGLCYGLSLFYLLAVAAVIVFYKFSGFGPLKFMQASSIFLGPLQGLVSAALAAFFVKEKTKSG